MQFMDKYTSVCVNEREITYRRLRIRRSTICGNTDSLEPKSPVFTSLKYITFSTTIC